MEKTWRRLSLIGGIILAGIALVFTDQLVAFLWKYVWGPIVADAQNQMSAVHNGVTAYRGYNLVNEILYAGILVGSLLGVRKLLERLDITIDQRFVLSLTPMILVGALLRVVEDAALVSFPWNIPLISPVIYLSVFIGTVGLIYLASLLVARGYTEGHGRVLFLLGTVAAGLLTVLLFTGNSGLSGEPLLYILPPVSVILAVGITRLISRSRPGSWANTKLGATIAAGHAVDGSSTAVSIAALGYGEKHPVSQAVMDITGTPYGFLVLKLLLPALILAFISREDDDPFTLLLLLAILTVGLAPGIRNLVRAMLGV